MSRQTVIIFGGSSGMGLGTARLLAKAGYEIVIVGRSQEKLDKALTQIGKGKSYALDASREDSVRKFFTSTPPFDHLVISAADFVMGPFLEMDTQEARRFFDSKFWLQYSVAKYGAQKIHKEGSITFFSGISSEKPLKDLSTASAINSAINGLVRALAVELAPIRCNAIAPGTIYTPVWDTVPERERVAYFESTSQKLPAKRIGHPEDVAKVVKLCIECTFMTGNIITCDGGERLI